MALILLPWDLEEEILSRVPARSLRRLRFTCKRWNDLIKDREFIKKHLDKAAKEHVVLMLNDLRVYSMNGNLHGIHDNVVDPQTLLNLNEFHNSEQAVELHKIFHCDGLLLGIATRELRLVVWNPLTGQTRWIQYSARYKYNCNFALGYGNNRSCQSYKILRYTWKDGVGHWVPKCGIYEFSSDSWRDLNDTTPKCFIGLSNGVSLKGNTYWLASDINVGKILLSFDFSTEKFRSLCTPPLANFGGFAMSLSVVREERLSVLYYSFFHQPKIEIWMTTDAMIDQTKDLSWSKFLSVDDLYKSLPPKCFFIDTAFFIDEKNKAAVLCNLECYKMGLTNIDAYIVGEENRCIQLPLGEYRSEPVKPLIYSYVPSLVQIQ